MVTLGLYGYLENVKVNKGEFTTLRATLHLTGLFATKFNNGKIAILWATLET